MHSYYMNRQKKTATTASGGHTPTFTGGCVLYDQLVFAGAKSKALGGTARQHTEWILDEETTYIFAASNLRGSAGGISIHVEFYEH